MTNAAVFLDRDGTIIEDPGYLNHPDQVKLLAGAGEALRELQQLGFKTVLVSNQSGVARGLVTEEGLEQIHERLRSLLSSRGASLDGIYYCPYHPEGVIPKYRRDSDWRKPNPGMLLAAAQEMGLDLASSWMIGNNQSDIDAGRNAGCRTILISTTRAAPTKGEGRPDHIAVNIREAVNMIKRFRRTERIPSAADEPIVDQDPDEDQDQDVLEEHDYTVTSLEAEQLAAESPQVEPPPEAYESIPSDGETQQLLAEILDQLKRMQKRDVFNEVSIMRVLAGVVQAFVPFCLLTAVWFLQSPEPQYNHIFTALGFGAVLQVMSLTFYIMQSRR
jgi:D-glycero-D-manno-heptose 1,7-bisphosphate phosphatase